MTRPEGWSQRRDEGSMRILLSNDDGFYAPGLRQLYQHLRAFHEVWVVAPDSEQSSTGHSLTLRNILRLFPRGEQQYVCSGFPADCIHLGLRELLQDKPVDLVISGINRGSNLGQDIYYSGTCAAAREASFLGVPALSISLDARVKEQAHFHHAFPIIDFIIEEKIYSDIPPLCSLNINVPNAEDYRGQWSFCPVGFARYQGQILRSTDPKGVDYFWLGSGQRKIDAANYETDVYWLEKSVASISLCQWIPAQRLEVSELSSRLAQLEKRKIVDN